MRTRFLIPAFVAAVTAAGCGIGDGSGTADGMLWILGCQDGDPLGTPDKPQLFHLDPTFFAAEPIEDISDGAPTNRLIIRMQRNGNATEITDTLYFDVRDSAEVARCLRGKTNAGIPDWNTTSGAVVDDLNGVPPADQQAWCEAPVTVPGVARIHLVPFGPVAVSFAPLASCHSDMHPPAQVNITGVARDGWIQFENFGDAIEANQATTASDARHPIINTHDSGFKVNYGQQLTASFHIEMGDERVAAAMRDKKQPPTDPQIGGFLDGRFDFDFQRGRSAQTFP
jgi:hypothetical protein